MQMEMEGGGLASCLSMLVLIACQPAQTQYSISLSVRVHLEEESEK